jgi:L-amino acid N-acyltransferase YncA
MTYTTRPAHPNDAAAIAAIYNQGIADRVATFETRPRTVEDIQAWFAAPHPLVVVEQMVKNSGQVSAFAAASAYRARACYAGVAEFSVYVGRPWRGQGVGRLAMAGLLEACQQAGYWKLVSRIFVENKASRHLMQSLGFREVGIYEKHAQLDGQWRDVVIVEKLLAANLKGSVQGG